MSKAYLHDIPIELFTKYFLNNDLDANAISANARYQPIYEDYIQSFFYKCAFANPFAEFDKTLPKYFILKTAQCPVFQSDSSDYIAKYTHILFNTSENLSLIYPLLKKDIQNDIQNSNSIVEQQKKYQDYLKKSEIDLYQALEGEENLAINKRFKSYNISITGQDIYYNPIPSIATKLFNNLSLYQYYAEIDGKIFYQLINRAEIDLKNFYLEYTPDDAINRKNYNLSKYFPNLVVLANKNFDNEKKVFYYNVVDEYNNIKGKIYELSQLKVLSFDKNNLGSNYVSGHWVVDGIKTTETSLVDVPHVDPITRLWMFGKYPLKSAENNYSIKAKDIYYEFIDTYTDSKKYFSRKTLPLTPLMKYHEEMRNIKSKYNIAFNNKSFYPKNLKFMELMNSLNKQEYFLGLSNIETLKLLFSNAENLKIIHVIDSPSIDKDQTCIKNLEDYSIYVEKKANSDHISINSLLNSLSVSQENPTVNTEFFQNFIDVSFLKDNYLSKKKNETNTNTPIIVDSDLPMISDISQKSDAINFIINLFVKPEISILDSTKEIYLTENLNKLILENIKNSDTYKTDFLIPFDNAEMSQLKEIIESDNTKHNYFYYMNNRYSLINIENNLFMIQDIVFKNNIIPESIKIYPIIIYIKKFLDYFYSNITFLQDKTNIGSEQIEDESKSLIMRKVFSTIGMKDTIDLLQLIIDDPSKDIINIGYLQLKSYLRSIYQYKNLYDDNEKSESFINNYKDAIIKLSSDALQKFNNKSGNYLYLNKTELKDYLKGYSLNLIRLFNKDFEKNTGEICDGYVGFMSYKNDHNSYIYTKINNEPLITENSLINSTKLNISDEEIYNIVKYVKDKNPIEKILNYKTFNTDNDEIKFLINEKKYENSIQAIRSSVLYKNNNISKETISIYKPQNFSTISIKDKIYDLIVSYLYADLKDESSVYNISFYKDNYLNYINVLNTYNNNYINNNNKYNIKYVFNYNENDKNIFLKSLKMKFN